MLKITPEAKSISPELPAPNACGISARMQAAEHGSASTSAPADVTWRIVEAAVMKTFAVGVTDINGDRRGVARSALARQVAMYLAHVACHHSFTEVGRMANRDRTTVAHACAVVEDERDDPLFDEALTHLERSVVLMAHRSAPSGDN